MARVLISGYYGFGNAGDEAILTALRGGLGGHSLCVLSGDPAGTSREHGVAAVERMRPAAVLSAIRNCDLVISGGGSLLQDASGPWSVPYYAGICWLALRLGRPFTVYAQGVGPVRSPWRFRMLRVFDRARHITVRDQASADLLRRAGVRRAPLQVTADAALALAPPAPSPGGRALAALGVAAKPPVFAFAMRPWHGNGFSVAVASAADALLRRHGGSVVFVPMQFPEDVEACEAVRARMQEPAAVVGRRLSTAEWLRLFTCFDLVVGMRLHALIFAATVGVMPIGLSYDPKVDAFLGALGAPPPLDVRGLGGSALSDRLLAGFPVPAEARLNLRERVRAMQARARVNDEVVRALLAGA